MLHSGVFGSQERVVREIYCEGCWSVFAAVCYGRKRVSDSK